MSDMSRHRPCRSRSPLSPLLYLPRLREPASRDRDDVAQRAHLLCRSVRADVLFDDIGDLRAGSAVDEDDETEGLSRLVLVVESIERVLQSDRALVAVVPLL